ncbi:MAG: universal stress protein [Hyphomicrobiaceae bacterium]
MPVKTILAYLNSSTHAHQVLAAVVAVARRSDAHIIGLHVVPQVTIPAIVPFEVTGEILEVQRKALDEEADKVAAEFKKVMGGLSLPNEWRCVKAAHYDVAQIVDAHARTADLIVAGQSDSEGNIYQPTDVTEDIMMEAGRPVLVVPRKGVVEKIGERVAIAWNNSREAARAVFDALPVMTPSADVRVLSVDPFKGKKSDPDLPSSEIATALARHGLKAEAAVAISMGGDIAGEIIARAGDMRADLLVMGGYGHSRLRELVFGGATRDILDRMTIPVLLSH